MIISKNLTVVEGIIMSCIIYQTNKKTGIKYAYKSESYRDPVTKKPRSKRTYLGRVDPITDEIIQKVARTVWLRGGNVGSGRRYV